MFFIWIIILGLLQSAVSLNINFLVLFSIFAGLRKGPFGGLLIGIYIGVIAEALSSSVLGLNFMLYSGIGLLSGAIKQRIYYKEGIVMEFLFSFFGMLFFYMAYFAFTKTAQAEMVFTVFFSSLISPLLFRLIEANPAQ